MNGFKIAFRPTAGQGDALRAAGEDALRLAGAVSRAAAALDRCGGLEAFSAPLRRLGGRVEATGGRLNGLGGRLEEIRTVYLQSEARMLEKLDALPASPAPEGGMGGWEGGMGARGDEGTGGVPGWTEQAWDWLQEDHALWTSAPAGTALGGVLSGGAVLSALRYESAFGGDGALDTEDGFSLGYTAGGTFSVLHAGLDGRVGTEDFGLYAEAAGDLGVVTANGAVGIFETDEGYFVGAQGELGAYAAEGEVTGGLDLGFMKLGGTLKGSVGAGVEGQIGCSDGVFELGASATLGLGGGFSLSLDFSPTIDWVAGLFDQ